MTSLIKAILVLVAAVICCSVPSRAGEATSVQRPGVLTFGVVPQQSASRLARMWAPVLAHIAENLDVEIRFQTTKDIPTFEACLAEGRYDIAYMNPYHYAVFAEISGYRALAHQTDKALRGLIVVRTDSPIQRIEELEGLTVAFPSPGAFGASVLTRAEIRKRGIRITPAYVKSHDSVYRAIAAGLMPAGGGVVRTFHAIPEELRDQLRVIYRTAEYTPHALATAPNVTEALRAQLRDVMAGMTTEAPDAVASIGMTGLEGAVDTAWDDVRALGITPEQAGLEIGETIRCPSG